MKRIGLMVLVIYTLLLTACKEEITVKPTSIPPTDEQMAIFSVTAISTPERISTEAPTHTLESTGTPEPTDIPTVSIPGLTATADAMLSALESPGEKLAYITESEQLRLYNSYDRTEIILLENAMWFRLSPDGTVAFNKLDENDLALYIFDPRTQITETIKGQ